jgi:hypothetical protein
VYLYAFILTKERGEKGIRSQHQNESIINSYDVPAAGPPQLFSFHETAEKIIRKAEEVVVVAVI